MSTGKRLPLALAALCLGLCTLGTVGAARMQTPAANAAPAGDRSRLATLQREAVFLLTQAARTDVSRDDARRGLREASQRIEALAAALERGASSGPTASGSAAPGPATPGSAAPGSARLVGERRCYWTCAARRASWPRHPRLTARRALDTGPYLALLERARIQIDGEVALGLSFQGSYSQTRVKEPAYGGHASSMGPAPSAPPEPAGDAMPSPVSFEEATRLPTRTYCGGPTKDHILESGGNGVALIDYDDDGDLDIYLVTAAELTPARARIPHRNALYRNLGGWKFEEVSTQAGVDAAAWGNGVCAGDADGDGRLDLYVTNWGPNFLFRNRGDGTFEEIAPRAGVTAGGWSTGCAFLDADADGDLDLYVARYVETTWDEVLRAQRTFVWRNGPRGMVGPVGLRGEADLFFENLGQGRFRDATAASGLTDAARAYGFGVLATDYDDDGRVDLFVANDSNPNFLYRNLGSGRFESVGLLAGVAVNGEARAQAGMGVDAGDYDGDGRLDLVLTAFAHDRNSLYRNIDGHQFEDVSVATGLAAPTFVRMGWGTAFLDADLDGRLDLFFANGHIFSDVDSYPQLGETYRQKNQLLLNTGHALPRRVRTRGSRPAGRARGPRPRHRRSRQRRRSRHRREQHGRSAHAAREPPDRESPDAVTASRDRSTLGRLPCRLADREPIRDRREADDRGRRPNADPRDPFRRELSLAERSAGTRRPGCARRSGGRGGPHARRPPLAMAMDSPPIVCTCSSCRSRRPCRT